MHWKQSPQEKAIFELFAHEGAPPLARLGFIDKDSAACELAPAFAGTPAGARLRFQFVSDPKSVNVRDGASGQVLGLIPLSWMDSGTLNLAGEKLVWEYTGVFAKSRQWVDGRGTVLAHIDAIDLPSPTAVKLGAASHATPLLVALGWFLKLRCDWTPLRDFLAPTGPAFAWALPERFLRWDESEHPEAQFELCYGGEDGEPLAQLTILSASLAAGAVKRFGGATDEGKWIFELGPPAAGIRRLEVKSAETKAVAATMEVDAAFAGRLSYADVRYSWSCVANQAGVRTWTFTGPDGKPILEQLEESEDDADFELKLHGEHPRASFLAFVGFYLLAMRYLQEGKDLFNVSLASLSGDGDGDGDGDSAGGTSTGSTGSTGKAIGTAVDVAGSIFDLLD